jgi:hypothetical protein
MIPEFGLGEVLPPYMENDVVGQFSPRSPYAASTQELVERFGTSQERCVILRGLLNFRRGLRQLGFQNGLQWIDGSFVENCEAIKGRPPGDVDIVSLLNRPVDIHDEVGWEQFINHHLDTWFNSEWTKENHRCDAYYLDLGIEPRLIAEQSAYWFGLFSHQRDTFRWKGLVQLDLADGDQGAEAALNILDQAW